MVNIVGGMLEKAVQLFDLPAHYEKDVDKFLVEQRKSKIRTDLSLPKKWNSFLRQTKIEKDDAITKFMNKHPSSKKSKEEIAIAANDEKDYREIKAAYRGIRFSNAFDKFGTCLEYENLIQEIQFGSKKKFLYLLGEGVQLPNFAFLTAVMFILRFLHPLLRSSEEDNSSVGV